MAERFAPEFVWTAVWSGKNYLADTATLSVLSEMRYSYEQNL